MFILTFFALYGSDCNAIYGSDGWDDTFGVISLFIMIVFFLELSLASTRVF